MLCELEVGVVLVDIVVDLLVLFFVGDVLEVVLLLICCEVFDFLVLLCVFGDGDYVLELFYGLMVVFKDIGVCFLVGMLLWL